MKNLDICSFENSVPEWFADWVKLGITKYDSVSRQVSLLLSDNNLEEALAIYDDILNKTAKDFIWTHKGNNRIH